MSIKGVLISFCAIICLGVSSAKEDSGVEMIEPGWISFQDMPVEQVLDVYKRYTGSKLFVDSRVYRVRTGITWTNDRRVSSAEAGRMIETVLLDQSAVVVTRLGTNGVSVTFNDALPTRKREGATGK